jgi:hypothetical protein
MMERVMERRREAGSGASFSVSLELSTSPRMAMIARIAGRKGLRASSQA